jgi:sterol desaturase/sphingolipid hydroxylase (fatty acid hydroxylase superfamily)
MPAPPARRRWAVNIGLTVLLSALVGVAFPVLSVGMALLAAHEGFGLFHSTAWPAWFELPVAFLVLNLGRYAQHALLHRVPLLWRLHRVIGSISDTRARRAPCRGTRNTTTRCT